MEIRARPEPVLFLWSKIVAPAERPEKGLRDGKII